MHRPRGGMAFKPLVTLSTNASIPLAKRGSQAALSPFCGAVGIAPLWQTPHARAYTASGSCAAWALNESISTPATISNFFIRPTSSGRGTYRVLCADDLKRSREHLSSGWEKAHTKSAPLYTGVIETETTQLAALHVARQPARLCRKGSAPATPLYARPHGYPDASQEPYYRSVPTGQLPYQRRQGRPVPGRFRP